MSGAMHPAQAVRQASFQQLLEAFAAGDPHGLVDDDCGTRVPCPWCRHHDHNGFTLQVVSDNLLRCWRCRRETNRAGIERRVLEQPSRLEALWLSLAVDPW